MTLNSYRDLYLKDLVTLKEIEEETKGFNNLPNASTKIEEAKKLIIDKKTFKKIAEDTIELVGETCIENDMLKEENKKLEDENKFYKKKLDDNKIIYEDALINHRKKYSSSLVKKEGNSALERGWHELQLKAKRNQKL